MSRLQRQLEKLRAQPYAVRKRFVTMGALTLTILLVAGVYGLQGIARNQTTADEVQVARTAQRPFAVLRNTWSDMINYVEGVGESILPGILFGPRQEEPEVEGDGFVTHPGVKLEAKEE